MKSVRESVFNSPTIRMAYIYTRNTIHTLHGACCMQQSCTMYVCWPLKSNRKGKEKHKITPPQRDIHADLTLLAQVVKPE